VSDIAPRGTDTWAVAADVGGTTTRVGLVASDGTIEIVATEATPRDPDELVRMLGEHYRSAATTREAPVRRWGVGVPGLVDVAAGSVANALNLGIERPFPLADRLEAATGVRPVLRNDVNCAALGARDVLAPRGGDRLRDLVYISIGTGLAAGLVLGGRLHRGLHGAAGQIGCAETIVSGTALSAEAPNGDPALLWDDAYRDDPHCVSVRRRFADALAWLVQGQAMALDPQAVVIGGGVSRVGDPLRADLEAAMRHRADESRLVRRYRLGAQVTLVPPDLELGVAGAGLGALRGSSV
jgi:predicted NBD/HSP70 family sugar kinase